LVSSFTDERPNCLRLQLGELGSVLLDPQPGAGQLGPRHRQFRLALGQQGA
jgi:hypothetical protein